MKNRKRFKPTGGFEISEEGVIKKYTGEETNVVIPQEIRGITVRAIVGSNPSTLKGLSFSKKKLTSVVIPENRRLCISQKPINSAYNPEQRDANR